MIDLGLVFGCLVAGVVGFFIGGWVRGYQQYRQVHPKKEKQWDYFAVNIPTRCTLHVYRMPVLTYDGISILSFGSLNHSCDVSVIGCDTAVVTKCSYDDNRARQVVNLND